MSGVNLHVHYSADLYDSYSDHSLTPFDSVLMSRLYAEQLKRNLAGPLLDLGTGTARLLLKIAARPAFRNLRMIGTDFYEDMLAIAERNVRDGEMRDRIQIVAADVHALPFSAASFPFAISRSTIHHWADPAAAIGEIDRVLLPGGCAIIHDVRRDPPLQALQTFNQLRQQAGVEPSRLHEKHTPGEIRVFAERAGLAGRFKMFTPDRGLSALGMELFFWK